MNNLNTTDIVIRLLVITVFSGIIGFERERQNAHAGLRTHLLVGIASTIIALIQQSIVGEIIALHAVNPDIGNMIRSDPARLIAQVVSGIGFLGAGTIIVTKRNISGLTTAASIWSVSGLGLAVGMGYLEVGIFGFLFLYATLTLVKRLYKYQFEERVYIEYIGGSTTMIQIEAIFKELGIVSQHRSFQTKPLGDDLVYASVFDVKGPKEIHVENLVSEMSKNKNIASVQLTNLYH